MKQLNYKKMGLASNLITVLLAFVFALSACSSKDDEGLDEAIEAEDSDQNSEAGDGDLAASEENAANKDSDASLASADISEEMASADVLADDNIDMGSDNAALYGEAQAGGMESNVQIMSPLPEGEDDNFASGESMDMMAVASAPVETTASAVTSAPAMIPSGEGRVKYVRSDRLSIYSQPNASSASLGKLEKGDHILVSIEGDWARLASGGFVQLASLSDKGIGRSRGQGTWMDR
jgi:hypothetical protein